MILSEAFVQCSTVWSFWSVHQAEYFANPPSVCYVALLQHSGAIATVCSVLLRGLTLCKCVVFVC